MVNKRFGTLVFLLSGMLSQGQVTYNIRIDVADKQNGSGNMICINDTFFIPTTVVETPLPNLTNSRSLMQIKSDGSGEIGIRAGCGNMFGCSPNASDAILSFKEALK